jgi:pimeloyl-ACP methyl ester carboxylesterase
MEIIKAKIKSSKGNLAAVIHSPKERTRLLAVLCPGYLDSKDYRHLVKLAEALCLKGYTAVRFDPTGTWESEGDISDYTTTQYLEDIRNIVEHMLRQSDYEHILLGGHSRGGQLSILYAARDPRISSVLAIMPSSHRTMVGLRYEEWKKVGVSISHRDIPNNKEQEKEFRVPFSHAEDSRNRYNVVEEVKSVKAPILFIAGELDETVIPEYVKEIFDNANEQKKFIVVPDIGHDYRHNDQQIAVVNDLILKELIPN